MIKFFLLLIGIILTIVTIFLVISNQPKATAIISAFFAFLSYFISLYPTILNQEKVEPNVILSSNALDLITTDAYDLKATISPDDCQVKWNSNNVDIVIVDNNGHLEAVNEGRATITATIIYKENEYTDTCDITVYNPVVNLNSSCSLYTGETSNLPVVTVPKNADIAWNSSNFDIVSVNDNGTIEGKSEGTATITATMVYNNVSYSADCAITVKSLIEESDKTLNDNIESDKQETIISELDQNSDLQEPEINTVSIRDVAWLDDEKIYKDDYATTMRGEEWTDCIRFGSSNINSDGTSVLRVVCDQKYNKFTAEIAPQEGFDKTESVTLYIYGGTDDQQTFKDEFPIDYSTKPFKVEYDLSNTDELYFWKSGNYNQGRIAGQYINGYTGMGVLMRDAYLYQ